MLNFHKLFHGSLIVAQNRVSNRNCIHFLRFTDKGLIHLFFIASTFHYLRTFTILDSNTVK